MKKLLVTVVLCLATLGAANAQKNAVGLRLGGGAELLYQRDLTQKNFLQFTLNVPDWNGFAATGLYNWRCCEWNWTPKTCDWHLNAGVGAAIGVYNFNDAGLFLGAVGSCSFGCEFKRVPISIDIDYRPTIGIANSDFFTPGFWNFGLAVAYHF